MAGAVALAACAAALSIPGDGPADGVRRRGSATRGTRDEAMEGA